MTPDESYGKRPDLLPEFLRTPRSREAAGASALTAEQSRAHEARSLARMPATWGGEVDWDEVAHEHWWYDDDPEAERMLAGLVRERFAAGAPAVLFWETPSLPSVALPAGVFADNVAAVLEAAASFWLFLPEAETLVECRMDGRVSVARVP